MGTYKYVPDLMPEQERLALVAKITDLAGKVDHGVARSVLNNAVAELVNEIDNIEQGYRDQAGETPARHRPRK